MAMEAHARDRQGLQFGLGLPIARHFKHPLRVAPANPVTLSSQTSTDKLGEAELMRRAKSGDAAAFTALVAPHHQTAFRLAYHLTHDPSDAEDAVQEGMIRAFRALDRFRDGAPLKPWLLKIVLNEARARIRARTRTVNLFGRLSGIPLTTSPDPVFEVLAAETRDEVAASLATLPAIHRDVITMRYFLELTEREMAEVLGCAPGTVKSRLSRALDQLRVGLDPAETRRP